MTQRELSPKERTLLDILQEEEHNQRSISKSSGFSLGMTNLLLKRLVKKGYVKVVSLNGRTLKYMLTPKGFSEKVHRSYDFVLATIRNLNTIKNRIQDIVREKGGNFGSIYVLGDNELAQLACEALEDIDIPTSRIYSTEEIDLNDDQINPMVLICDLKSRLEDLKKADGQFEYIEMAGLLADILPKQ